MSDTKTELEKAPQPAGAEAPFSDWRDQVIECPRCKSKNVETTTIGFLGPRERDPNRAKCCACQHTGNAGDWYMIQHTISRDSH